MEVNSHTFLGPPKPASLPSLELRKKPLAQIGFVFECNELKMAFARVDNVQWRKKLLNINIFPDKLRENTVLVF